MLRARLFAAITFAAFSLAAGGTLGLAISHPAPTTPRDSSAWMALGLAAEQAGDFPRAAECLLRAEQIDRQYLPAWTAANFFLRRSNDAEFWRAAVQAAAMSYDDPAPLIDLADHREARAAVALERLGDTPRLERGYLHFLIGQARWPEAQAVAAQLAARKDPQDRELLLVFTDRLIAAGRVEATLQLTNGDFRTRPSGHGFDWRMTAPPGGASRWQPARLQFWLASSTPDACPLLDQWVALAPGKYRLQFQYRTEGLAEQTGLRWVVSRNGIEEAAGPPLARAAGGEQNAAWSFGVKTRGVYQLQLVYVRMPGTIHIEGSVEIASVALEVL
jgi:tetratricopeptide (TPR) repeat protein